LTGLFVIAEEKKNLMIHVSVFVLFIGTVKLIAEYQVSKPVQKVTQFLQPSETPSMSSTGGMQRKFDFGSFVLKISFDSFL